MQAAFVIGVLSLFGAAWVLKEVSAETTDCCIMSCVIVEEERCDDIIRIGNERSGTSSKRIYANQAFPKEGRNFRTVDDEVEKATKNAMHKISQLQGIMADALYNFNEFSEETRKNFSAPGGNESAQYTSNVNNMLVRLANVNETFKEVSATLKGADRLTCSRPPPVTQCPPKILSMLKEDRTFLADWCGMGMKNDEIPTSAFSVSPYHPDTGYRNTQGIRYGRGINFATDAGSDQWILIDLGQSKSLSGILVQCGYLGWCTTSFFLECGDNVESLEYIRESGEKKVFTASDVRDDAFSLPEVRSCRYVRIHAETTSTAYMAMRLELLSSDCFGLY